MPDSPSKLLAEIVHEDNILVGLPTEDRATVMKALVDNMISTKLVTDIDGPALARLLNEREAKGTTAIGHGVAIPHARIDFSDEPLAAFALLRDGSGFQALDGKNVNFVFMLLTPVDEEEIHQATLKAVTYFVKTNVHLRALSGCKTPKDVKQVFEDYA